MHYGANGDHFIMVFEILGVNLLEIMKRYDYKGIPMPLVRRMSKQVLIGLDYLHRVCKIIHTDLKPENTIVALGNDKLEDIIKNGCIKKPNKNKSNMMMDSDNKQFIPNSGHKYKPMNQEGDTLLSNVDTDGLTKQQKKKLKKKIKNERKQDEKDDDKDDDKNPD
jgi:serine/threonine-protein kinase SRPK3